MKKHNNRILYVLGSGHYFLSHRLPTAEAASNTGYAVHVLAIDNQAAQKITDLGYVFHARRWQKDTTPLLSTIMAIIQLIFVVWKISPNIVHCIGLKTAPVGLFTTFLFWRTRFLFSINGLGYFFAKSGQSFVLAVMRSGVLFLFRWISRFRKIELIFQNKDDKQFFIKHRIGNRSIFHLVRGSGVDTQKYLSDIYPSGPPVFGLACRMVKIKGVEEAIEAISQLQAQNIPVKLLLAGNIDRGNPSSLTEASIKSLCGHEYIEWLGYVDDMREFWERCHFAVLPSHGGEGVPKSLLEAAAMQRALVVSNTNGNRDLVVDGVNGFLCEPKNVKSLKDAFTNCVLSDFKVLGNASRKHIFNLKMDSDSITRAFTEIYSS